LRISNSRLGREGRQTCQPLAQVVRENERPPARLDGLQFTGCESFIELRSSDARQLNRFSDGVGQFIGWDIVYGGPRVFENDCQITSEEPLRLRGNRLSKLAQYP